MMNDMVEMFAYNSWATERIFGLLNSLSADEFDRDLKSSHSSIRQTLIHLVSAEWIWLRRWSGESPKSVPDDWKMSSVEAIRQVWAENDRQLRHFLGTAEDLNREVVYQNVKGDSFREPLSVLARHLVNHSTYHRGQIIAMVRQLGGAGISTDYILFYRQNT